MGDCSTNVRKLKTVREQNNTLEITVAFWLNRSLNTTEIRYDLRMTLRMWWNHKWPFGFPYLPSFKLDCMAIIPNNEDNRILHIQMNLVSNVWDQFSAMKICKNISKEDILSEYVDIVWYCQRYCDFEKINQIKLWYKILMLSKTRKISMMSFCHGDFSV